MIPEDQTLATGATITLRLTQDALVNGITLPLGQPAIRPGVNQWRPCMQVLVSSLRYKDGIYPVRLQVYDLDGLLCIYIPGAITRDVAKESADRGSARWD